MGIEKKLMESFEKWIDDPNWAACRTGELAWLRHFISVWLKRHSIKRLEKIIRFVFAQE